MTEQNIQDLRKIVGSEDCYDDKAHLSAYCYDATKERKYPECVIFPHNEQEVSQILKYCNTHKIPIVPRGAGSGFTGGALAVNGGFVFTLLKHMNNIFESDKENKYSLVQPGVVYMQLQKEG